MFIRKIFKFLGLFFIILSLSLTISSTVQSHYQEKQETKLIDTFFAEKTPTQEVTNSASPVLMVLEIPKIKLRKPLYSLTSPQNNVDKNIEILTPSKMPNEPNSNLILAGHSGNAPNAYFNDLDKLSLNDEIIIYYDKVYYYQLTDIKEIPKTGTMSVNLNPDINRLTLVTCKKNDLHTQLVFTATLSSTKKLPN